MNRATVRGLSVAFAARPRGPQRLALHDVSFEVAAGERIAVLGPSGAGKSTLCRAILGLVELRQGEIVIDGQPWHTLTEAERRPLRRTLQYVPQDAGAALDPQQTVLEHVVETLSVLRRRPPVAAEDEAHELLRRLGIAHRARALPRELSSGEQCRVTLARVLALDPTLVVADEPTSGLDRRRAAEVMADLLGQLPDGAACLWVTHDVRLARQWCTRALVLYEGAIVDDLRWPDGEPTHRWSRAALSESA